MSAHRSDRMAESIRRMMPELLRGIKDPRVSQMLSVVRVEASSDLSRARIFVSALEGAEQSRRSVEGLKSAGGMLRHEISRSLGLKKAPMLEFIADDSIAHSAKIADMLKDLNPGESDSNNE